jgi:tetratricopeptide (TPR) repeat protein
MALGEVATMGKPGRNDPCPCGSGKKYKKCCLVANAAHKSPAPVLKSRDQPYVFADDDFDDDVSNRIVDLIDAGQLDEAEQAARDLLSRYPGIYDGHMRLGAVYKARGDCKKAAEHLRLAAAMATSPDQDHELSDSLLAEANELDPPAQR